MLPDAACVAEARRWLERARADIRAAEVDLAAEPPLVEDARFHCQQAVEKALKGFLTWNGRVFRKTHDLVELGHLCAVVAPDLEPLLREAAPLTEYAWAYRYPGEWDVPERGEVEDDLGLARSVLGAVVGRLAVPE